MKVNYIGIAAARQYLSAQVFRHAENILHDGARVLKHTRVDAESLTGHRVIFARDGMAFCNNANLLNVFAGAVSASSAQARVFVIITRGSSVNCPTEDSSDEMEMMMPGGMMNFDPSSMPDMGGNMPDLGGGRGGSMPNMGGGPGGGQ